MNLAMCPKTVHTPGGAYSHTVKVPENASWLVIAGQVGVDPKGKLVGGGIRKQADQVFQNILSCLKANNMTKKDVLDITSSYFKKNKQDVNIIINLIKKTLIIN